MPSVMTEHFVTVQKHVMPSPAVNPVLTPAQVSHAMKIMINVSVNSHLNRDLYL
jgi:hypothetical protein